MQKKISILLITLFIALSSASGIESATKTAEYLFTYDCTIKNIAIKAHEYYFGKVDAERIEFTEGRGIVLSPPQEGEALNYFIFPYVEIDGERFADIETTFYYEDMR